MPIRTLEEGTVLGDSRYEILSTIGNGGFGTTYLARDRRLDARCVIKELGVAELCSRDVTRQTVHAHRGCEDEFRRMRERFGREARLLNRVRHPNVVRVFDTWEELGTSYYAMDEVPGAVELGKAPRSVDPRQRWLQLERPMYAVLEALEEIHGLGIVHGDIAPDNILLRDDGEPIIIDFGTSKDQEQLARTRTAVMYKPGFAPVELMHPARLTESGAWSDLYSFGMTFFSLLAPDRFGDLGPTDAITRAKLVHGGAVDPYDPRVVVDQLVERHVPRAVATGLAQCVCLEPGDRPSSAAELRALFRARAQDPRPSTVEPPRVVRPTMIERSTDDGFEDASLELPDTAASSVQGSIVRSNWASIGAFVVGFLIVGAILLLANRGDVLAEGSAQAAAAEDVAVAATEPLSSDPDPLAAPSEDAAVRAGSGLGADVAADLLVAATEVSAPLAADPSVEEEREADRQANERDDDDSDDDDDRRSRRDDDDDDDARVLGALSSDQIRSVFRSHESEIERCWERSGATTQEEASVSAHVTIGPSGAVQNARMTGDNVGSLQDCMEREILTWDFPRPSNGGVVRVEFPYRFRAE